VYFATLSISARYFHTVISVMFFIYVCLSSTYGHLLLLEVDAVDVDRRLCTSLVTVFAVHWA